MNACVFDQALGCFKYTEMGGNHINSPGYIKLATVEN